MKSQLQTADALRAPMRAAMLSAIRRPMFFGAGAGSPPAAFAPSLKFNDARNSQYLAMRSIGVA